MNIIWELFCIEKFLLVHCSSSDRNEFVRQFQSDDSTLVALLSITAANSGKVNFEKFDAIDNIFFLID